mgnify:CR=1 FL=1
MKLVNARLGLELEFLENQVLNLTIESPERFSEVVYNLSKQVEGEEGEFILSNAEKELLLEKKAVVIANPLGVTCDEKRIVSQIYKNLSEKISSDYSACFPSPAAPSVLSPPVEAAAAAHPPASWNPIQSGPLFRSWRNKYCPPSIQRRISHTS